MGLRSSEKQAGNYAYACTRVKARKAFLLTNDTYPRLLVMGLPEISRFIGEGQYRIEVDELSSRFSGVNLIEAATYLNLARTYRGILGFTRGELEEMVRRYLSRWDLWNLKTVMRGKSYGATWEEVTEDLVPAGAYDMGFYATLFGCANLEEMADQLKRAGRGPEQMLLTMLRSGAQPSLADIENVLDKKYYSMLIKSVPDTVPANRLFRRYLAAEIDVVNLKTLFKLKFEAVSVEKVQELLVESGEELREAALKKLAAAETFDAFLSELAGTRIYESVREAAGRVQTTGSLNEVLTALDQHLSRKAHEFSHLYPLSVLPIIDYLLRKKIEVDNLRTIARGKQSGLPEDEIRSLLML